MIRSLSLFSLLCSLLVGLLGSTCQPMSGAPPELALRLDGIPAAMSEVLVVPPSGFVVNVDVIPGSAPLDPDSLEVDGFQWGGDATPALEGLFTATADGFVAEIPAAFAFAEGTFTLLAVLRDEEGRAGSALLSFAVRDFPAGAPPIGTGQQIWLDFESDRDGIPGPDFPLDLESFGLASPAAPALADAARALVIDAVLARTATAYGPDASGFSAAPVAVTFTATQPAAGDTTRLCVGGEDPAGGSTIGSVPIDLNNSNRNDVACGTIPPTGVFPRELLVFQNQSSFQAAFDPLRPERGGVPIGDGPWDFWLLEPDFDPDNTLPGLLLRYTEMMTGIEVFANALGSIVAHEAAHALGLVPPGAPGIGLFGGSDGASFTHSVEPDGSTPPGNYLMKAGNTFTFAKLAGLDGFALPAFREIELAYLHDRVVLAFQVTALLPPPMVAAVSPGVVDASSVLLTITGTDFVATPSVRAVLPTFSFGAIGESLQSPEQLTAWVVRSQMISGLYDIEVTNPDGQQAVLPDALLVP